MDMQKFVDALEAHTKALLVHAEALVKSGVAKIEAEVQTVETAVAAAVGKRPRGRPVAGETAPVATPPNLPSMVAQAAAAQPAVAAPVTPVAPVAAPAAAAANAGTLDAKSVSTILVDVAKKKGREFAVATLKEFAKGPKGTFDEVPADQYAAFVAKLKGEVQQAEAASDLGSLLG